MMNYNPEQEMFLLSIASNVGANCSGPRMNRCVYLEIQKWLKERRLKDWRIVWGPGVFVFQTQHDPDTEAYPTNVMFVSHNSSTSTYHISVAGTNANSLFDATEDFKVHEMRAWPYAPKKLRPVPKISHGFAQGLKALQEMVPPDDVPGPHLTLDRFLHDALQKEKGGIRIITGGHSQGGALSPLVALWLKDTQSRWDTNHVVERRGGISCWPTAGPTPGNADFATYYDERLPATTSLVNTLDVATKFFDWEEMEQVPELYEPEIDPGAEVRGLVRLLLRLARGNDYAHIAQGEGQVIPLTGSVNKALIRHSKDRCWNFMTQAGYQHTRAYFDLLGLEPPPDLGVDQFSGLCAQLPPSEL